MKKSLLPALRKELENTFGRKILSSRDCLLMVEDIYQKTGYSINANTLRRFFGLVKTAYSASPSTLTILCKYCGFNSIDEIEKISVSNVTEENINKEEVLRFLVALFKNLPLNSLHPDALMPAVQQTIPFLERTPALIDRFQREMAKTPGGQYHYFELSVNMDRLNGYYGDGLRYYLRANDSDEAQIFGNAVLVLRYWLSGNQELLESHMLAMPHGSPVNFPHIMGRYIGARLYQANIRNDSIDRIVLEATKYQVSMLNKKEASGGFQHFELPVCEALVLTGHLEEAREIIRRGKTASHSKEAGSGNPYFVWEQIINSKNSNNTKKGDPLQKEPATPFESGHINKKYNSLLSSLYNSRRQESLLKNMIAETGFHKFATL